MIDFEGKYVRVYWNSHKKCFSVQEKSNGKWLLLGHATEINLRESVFKVSEMGRLRVFREGHKNVHAFIYGYFTLNQDVFTEGIDSEAVGYRINEGAYFQTLDNGKPIYVAQYVHGKARDGKAKILAR